MIKPQKIVPAVWARKIAQGHNGLFELCPTYALHIIFSRNNTTTTQQHNNENNLKNIINNNNPLLFDLLCIININRPY